MEGLNRQEGKGEKEITKTKGGSMKGLLVLAVVAAGVVGMAMAAGAATPIYNWCTSTYQLAGAASDEASGSDSAVAMVLTAPSIAVTKLAKNERTGVQADYSVNAITGDTIEFVIVWSNAGEATADTLTLNDYVPSGMTYVAGSATETATNAGLSVSEAGGLVQLTSDDYQDVPGTDSGAAEGIMRFRATVD